MWPGQQPPGGEQNPQHHPYQQPGYPPPPPNGPPGFPPGPPPPWAGQRRAGLTAVVAVAAAAAVVAAVLVITDDGGGSGRGGASQAQPSLPGAADSGGSGGSGDAGGSGGGSGKLVTPAHSSGPSGTTLLIGRPGTGHTLDVYEDLRCPPCAMFEQSVGTTLRKDIEDGRYQASFHFAALIDKNLGGSGSTNALSALGAALNVSTDAFMDYKAALLSPQNHPEESKDAYADDSYLLNVAKEVPALADSASFRKDVTDGTYDRWAQEMASAFDKAGVDATPTVKLDDTTLTGSSGDTPMAATDFTLAVNTQLDGG
ncbi:thioredoxin domain-containing protein [Streptomyces sp. NPDC005336]|uniref:thioredoxin domain-containing protein n=1 Tax=unclassified Streptomyces TaxID=2593676 RepID=UPI0033B53433